MPARGLSLSVGHTNMDGIGGMAAALTQVIISPALNWMLVNSSLLALVRAALNDADRPRFAVDPTWAPNSDTETTANTDR